MGLLNLFRNAESRQKIEGAKAAKLEKLKEDVRSADWRYFDQTNELTGNKKRGAQLISRNSIDLQFPHQGGSQLHLKVFRNPDEVRVIIDRGQFVFHVQSGLTGPRFVTRFGARYRSKFGMNIEGFQPPSMKTNECMLANPMLFIMKMRELEELYLKPELYREENKVFHFVPKGLAEKLLT